MTRALLELPKMHASMITIGSRSLRLRHFFIFCSGEKLQVLKAKLQEAMKLRRLEERQKRQALFKLDNEDGFEEEEEEEELTDESEEDGEEEEEGDLAEEEEEGQDLEQEEEEEGNQEVLTII